MRRLTPSRASACRASFTADLRPFPCQGIYEYYRQEAAKLEAQSRPQPVKTVWAIGSMEWLAEQNKSK
jgi:hypothetical protein